MLCFDLIGTCIYIYIDSNKEHKYMPTVIAKIVATYLRLMLTPQSMMLTRSNKARFSCSAPWFGHLQYFTSIRLDITHIVSKVYPTHPTSN